MTFLFRTGITNFMIKFLCSLSFPTFPGKGFEKQSLLFTDWVPREDCFN